MRDVRSERTPTSDETSEFPVGDRASRPVPGVMCGLRSVRTPTSDETSEFPVGDQVDISAFD